MPAVKNKNESLVYSSLAELLAPVLKLLHFFTFYSILISVTPYSLCSLTAMRLDNRGVCCERRHVKWQKSPCFLSNLRIPG